MVGMQSATFTGGGVNRIEKAEIHTLLDNLEVKFDELHASLSDMTERLGPILTAESPSAVGIGAEVKSSSCSALTLRVRQLHDRLDVVAMTIAALKSRIDV